MFCKTENPKEAKGYNQNVHKGGKYVGETGSSIDQPQQKPNKTTQSEASQQTLGTLHMKINSSSKSADCSAYGSRTDADLPILSTFRSPLLALGVVAAPSIAPSQNP
ncbi:unnamed protein product, partial [Sphacelaria rigidula]